MSAFGRYRTTSTPPPWRGSPIEPRNILAPFAAVEMHNGRGLAINILLLGGQRFASATPPGRPIPNIVAHPGADRISSIASDRRLPRCRSTPGSA